MDIVFWASVSTGKVCLWGRYLSITCTALLALCFILARERKAKSPKKDTQLNLEV
jgi:hypothetical protein